MSHKHNLSGGDEVLSEINIVPFVDIVLVLLIIFMLTSAAIMKASLQVKLPKAASGGASVESTLNIVYTLEEELFLNGVESDREGIVDFIKQELKLNPKLQAVISADEGLLYGKVIKVVDLVKTNGVKSFALNIEPGAAPPTDTPNEIRE